MSMPPQLAKSKPRRPRHSEPRPTIELMTSISIHELRRVIPRYHGQINEPDVSLKYPDIAYLRLSASCLEIMGRNGYVGQTSPNHCHQSPNGNTTSATNALRNQVQVLE